MQYKLINLPMHCNLSKDMLKYVRFGYAKRRIYLLSGKYLNMSEFP